MGQNELLTRKTIIYITFDNVISFAVNDLMSNIFDDMRSLYEFSIDVSFIYGIVFHTEWTLYRGLLSV